MIGEEFLKLNATGVTEEGDYSIVNFNHENLEELIKNKVVDFPILIHKLGEGVGVMADPRIPDEWYSSKFCETCTPRNLLPYPQKLRIELSILRGVRKETEVEIDGVKMVMTSINVKSETRKRRI